MMRMMFRREAPAPEGATTKLIFIGNFSTRHPDAHLYSLWVDL
jgi:hypothetical protein